MKNPWLLSKSTLRLSIFSHFLSGYSAIILMNKTMGIILNIHFTTSPQSILLYNYPVGKNFNGFVGVILANIPWHCPEFSPVPSLRGALRFLHPRAQREGLRDVAISAFLSRSIMPHCMGNSQTVFFVAQFQRRNYVWDFRK